MLATSVYPGYLGLLTTGLLKVTNNVKSLSYLCNASLPVAFLGRRKLGSATP